MMSVSPKRRGWRGTLTEEDVRGMMWQLHKGEEEGTKLQQGHQRQECRLTRSPPCAQRMK